MGKENLALYVASYPDPTAATADFEALKEAEDAADFKVVGAVVIDRDAEGEVRVDEHGGGQVKSGTKGGAIAGLVIGLFAPPLLLSTAIGAGIGAGIGKLVERHEEKQLGVELEEYLPPGSSAIVAVLDDSYLDRIDDALSQASKKVSKAIDSGDVDKIEKALSDAGYQVSAATKS